MTQERKAPLTEWLIFKGDDTHRVLASGPVPSMDETFVTVVRKSVLEQARAELTQACDERENLRQERNQLREENARLKASIDNVDHNQYLKQISSLEKEVEELRDAILGLDIWGDELKEADRIRDEREGT